MWDHASLLGKAKTYYSRSIDGGEEMLAFWCLLGFELLARARLAQVHPSLLSNGKFSSALLAIGEPLDPEEERMAGSIAVSEALRRCARVSRQFTKDDVLFSVELMNRRNEEIHTGRRAFANLPSSAWKPRFFHLTKVLAEEQGTSLKDLLDTDGAQIAEIHIGAYHSEVRAEARKYAADARSRWQELGAHEMGIRRTAAENKFGLRRFAMGSKDIECPSCESQALVLSEVVRRAKAEIVGDVVRQGVTLLPVRLECGACDLILPTYEHLLALGLGDEWTSEFESDPIEHFDIQAEDVMGDPEDYRDWRDE